MAASTSGLSNTQLKSEMAAQAGPAETSATLVTDLWRFIEDSGDTDAFFALRQRVREWRENSEAKPQSSRQPERLRYVIEAQLPTLSAGRGGHVRRTTAILTKAEAKVIREQLVAGAKDGVIEVWTCDEALEQDRNHARMLAWLKTYCGIGGRYE